MAKPSCRSCPFSTAINTQRERMKRVAGSTAARLFFVFPPGSPHRLRRRRATHQCHRSNSRTRRHGLPGLGGLPDREHQNPRIPPLGHVPVRSMTSQRLAFDAGRAASLAQGPALTNARTDGFNRKRRGEPLAEQRQDQNGDGRSTDNSARKPWPIRPHLRREGSRR
jgi:hypothetical protein